MPKHYGQQDKFHLPRGRLSCWGAVSATGPPVPRSRPRVAAKMHRIAMNGRPLFMERTVDPLRDIPVGTPEGLEDEGNLRCPDRDRPLVGWRQPGRFASDHRRQKRLNLTIERFHPAVVAPSTVVIS